MAPHGPASSPSRFSPLPELLRLRGKPDAYPRPLEHFPPARDGWRRGVVSQPDAAPRPARPRDVGAHHGRARRARSPRRDDARRVSPLSPGLSAAAHALLVSDDQALAEARV